MSFQWPLVLIALGLVPLLGVAYWAWDRRRSADAARFTNPALLPNLVDRSPGRLRHLPAAVFGVALSAMIVGVARPHATISVPREEATVILAIDVSRSMTATDVKPSRLASAKAAAEAFLKEVPSKFRVGVVSFADRAVVTVPPTTDRATVASGIESLRSGGATALGDAVSLAAQLGQREKASDGTVPPTAVLLISDGSRDGGSTTPQAAARKAKSLHVPVYTIALGTPDGVVNATLTGGYRVTVKVPPNPATLREIASTTGGTFFRAPNDTRLKAVYEGLASRLGSHPENREITDWFAGGSAALLAAGGLLSTFWFGRIV